MEPIGSIIALGMAADTRRRRGFGGQAEVKAKSSMSEQPGPQGTPKLLPEHTETHPLDYIFPSNCKPIFVGIIPPKEYR